MFDLSGFSVRLEIRFRATEWGFESLSLRQFPRKWALFAVLQNALLFCNFAATVTATLARVALGRRGGDRPGQVATSFGFGDRPS